MDGGGSLVVSFTKPPLLPSKRAVSVPWGGIVAVPTVRLLAVDTKTTALDMDALTTSETPVVHTSTPTAQSTLHERAISMVFPAGLVVRDGANQVVTTTTTIRATEYTTPDSMPAALPPASAFTYCVDMRLDGIDYASFSEPVITWVDNFLGFPVGSVVPSAYFDPALNVWVPSENGQVVELLADGNGDIVAIDTDGDGDPDGDPGDFLGMEGATPGTYWRVPVSHFSIYDYNWPQFPPYAAAPQPALPVVVEEPEDPCREATNSFVTPRGAVFHDEVPIPGTGLTLHYASNRVSGYKQVIDVPVSGLLQEGVISEGALEAMAVIASLGTSREIVHFEPASNLHHRFVWDGLNSSGETSLGASNHTIELFYAYRGQYAVPFSVEGSLAFGLPGFPPSEQFPEIDTLEVTTRRSMRTVRLTSHVRTREIAHGWSLSNEHFLPSMRPEGQLLLRGDGTSARRDGQLVAAQVWSPSPGGYIAGIAFDREGFLYASDASNHVVYKLDPEGISAPEIIAGQFGQAGDCASGTEACGGPCTATSATLNGPSQLAVDSQGNVYVLEEAGYGKVKRVSGGTIQTIVRGGAVAPAIYRIGHAIHASH